MQLLRKGHSKSQSFRQGSERRSGGGVPPGKAADLVSQAKARDRKATTINVVKAALGINPAAAPAIVGAIARAVPEMAAVAAGAAAAEQPKQAAAIAKAAAAAAPSQAGAIVGAVCRAVPNQYQAIAIAVSQAAPDAGQEIINALTSAVPGLKPSIEKVLAGYGGTVPSVAVTLDQAAQPRTIDPATPTTLSTPFSPGPLAGGAGMPAAVPAVRGPAVGSPTSPSRERRPASPPARRAQFRAVDAITRHRKLCVEPHGQPLLMRWAGLVVE